MNDINAQYTEPLMQVRGLRKTYRKSRWPRPPLQVRAIDDVDLTVFRGESLGIAGESGSGKSTLISAMCGLVAPDQGEITLRGRSVWRGKKYDQRTWRAVQLVFQDPYTSLNPAFTLTETVMEPLINWLGMDRTAAKVRAHELLDQVGLGGALMERRPGSLSGGQRQRASIARALAAEPDILFLDESVSALDVSIQAQILQLLMDLRQGRDLTYVLVSHDISVLRIFCDRVVVMRHGSVVEECSAADLTPQQVQDPYTRALLEAVPSVDPVSV